MRAPWPIWLLPIWLLPIWLLLGPLISAPAAAQTAAAPMPKAVALLAAERDLGTAAAAMLPPTDAAGAGLYDGARGAFDRLIGGIAQHLQRNVSPAQPELAALARDAAAAREALLSGLAEALPLEQRRQIARNERVLRPDELATALPAALPALWAAWQSSSPAEQQQLLAQLEAQRWPPLPPAP